MDIKDATEEYQRQCESLPDAVPKPCNDCPWRRNAARGWLGPLDAKGWINRALSDGAIECHLTVEDSGQDWDEVKQCRGAAMFRANLGKMPRNPKVVVGPVDKDIVFSTPQQFLDHHEIGE